MNKKKDSSKIVSTYREVFKVGQCDYIIRLTFFGVEIGPSPPHRVSIDLFGKERKIAIFGFE